MATIEFVKTSEPKPLIISEKNNTETNWSQIYKKALIHKVMVSMLILVCINQFLGVFIPNPINYLSNLIDIKLNCNIGLASIIYVLTGIIAIKLFLSRDFYLPFLGNAVVPSSLMPVRIPEKTNVSIPLKSKPNTKVIYWSALATDDNTKVEKAYGDYSNSGVVITDDKGNANLAIQESTGYIVPCKFCKNHIKRHVHYRLAEGGILSPIKTIYY